MGRATVGPLIWKTALALSVALACAGIFDRDLWTPDEPRVAAISLEMSGSGSFAVPRLAGEPFVEKPPLYFAVAAVALRLFGGLAGSTGIVRATSALWGLATLFVTFLLARELYCTRTARIAVVVLATTFGFVLNSHWIRVDAALAFFVAAAAHCFVRTYLGGRFGWLAAAGLATAGAFLTKGPVALAYVGAAACGPFLWWCHECRRELRERRWHPLAHAVGAAAVVLPVALWLWRFRVTGGVALWDEWLWDNQLGRLLGSSTNLGHMRRGRPDYYLWTVLVFALPWTPLLFARVAAIVRAARARRALAADELLLGSWIVGTFAFLTLSATKRDIYLAPALPALALLCAHRSEDGLPRWCRQWLAAWVALCLAALVAIAALPWLASGAIDLPARARSALVPLSAPHLIASAIVLFCGTLLFVSRRRAGSAVRAAVATVLLYLAAFALPLRAVDAEKSLRGDVLEFAAGIPAERRSRIGAYVLDETVRGSLYYYAGWSPRDASGVVEDVLAGRSAEFDSLLVGTDDGRPRWGKPPRTPFERLATGAFGGRGDRGAIWIAGADR